MSEKVNGKKVVTVEQAVASPQFLEIFGPVLVLRDDIYKETMLKPSHMLLPLSLSDGTNTNTVVFGLPVLWGSNDTLPALVYTPKPYGEED